MFPKTRSGERAHREQKRQMEIRLIVDEIRAVTGNSGGARVLEFGCGDGFQIPYLRQLGTVVASDLGQSPGVTALDGVAFVQCSITDTPFADQEFDILFSNHVIEHVEDLPGAFREMRRIAKPSAVFAFSVPTNVWLLLSIPAEYYNKGRALTARLLGRRGSTTAAERQPGEHDGSQTAETSPKPSRLARLLLPPGHGVTEGFLDCYRRFRISAWEKQFTDGGFAILAVRPLLLYGPSEWPIIPTMPPRWRLCSSVLFLMQFSAQAKATHGGSASSPTKDRRA